jgi:hypothetical protein
MIIVICEDEKYWSDALNTAVSKWAASRKIELQCSSFASPDELVNHLDAHRDIDALLLDISLGEKVIDGMV